MIGNSCSDKAILELELALFEMRISFYFILEIADALSDLCLPLEKLC
jgi:hypothetical protein